MKKEFVTKCGVLRFMAALMPLLLLWQDACPAHAAAEYPGLSVIRVPAAVYPGQPEGQTVLEYPGLSVIRVPAAVYPEKTEVQTLSGEGLSGGRIPGNWQDTVDYRVLEKESKKVILIPGNRLKKTIPLDADTVTQIPRYIVEGDTSYVLDETSIVVEETGRSSSEGANVVTFSRKVEKLPDNDLERIEKSVTHEGIPCDLLCVVYEVTEEDEDGIPAEYSAACEYGGLETYSRSYPSAWQANVWYDACQIVGDIEVLTEEEMYGSVDTSPTESARTVRGNRRPTEEADVEEEEEEDPSPKPALKKFQLRKITPGEKEEEKKIPDIPVPLAAAAAGLLLLIPFLIWFTVLTAPLYALKKGEKYRYIGRIRLKKEDMEYTAYLTERLADRADIPVYKIKVPGQVRRETKGGMLQVNCPDGKKLSLICGEEVGFTLERG